MESAVMAPGVRPEPRASRKLVPNGVLGMLLFVFTESMMFAGFISAHAIVKSRAAGQMWPPFGQPRLPFEQTAFNTAALVASGLLLVFAHFAFRKERRRALIPFVASVLLGVFFVIAQGREWVALIQEGLTLTSSAYGGFFYVIVGAHALHALGAIAGMVWAANRLRTDRLSSDQFATVEVFWYFVVLVWPVLYLKVYL